MATFGFTDSSLLAWWFTAQQTEELPCSWCGKVNASCGLTSLTVQGFRRGLMLFVKHFALRQDGAAVFHESDARAVHSNVFSKRFRANFDLGSVQFSWRCPDKNVSLHGGFQQSAGTSLKCRCQPKEKYMQMMNNDRKTQTLMKKSLTNHTKRKAIIILWHEAKTSYVQNFLAYQSLFSCLALQAFQKSPQKQLFSSVINCFCSPCSLIYVKIAQISCVVGLITGGDHYTLGDLQMLITVIWLILFTKVYNYTN